MLTGNSDADDSSLPKQEEARLKEGIRKVLLSDNPNPNRIGCPDPKTLRDIAFHNNLRNPKLVEAVTLHIAECSPCVRDSMAYAEEYKGQRRSKRIVMAAAAAMVVAVVLWAAWQFRSQNGDAEHAGKVSTPPSQSPVTKESGDQRKKAPEVNEFQVATIELPVRWRSNAGAELPKLVLSRGKLLVRVGLPIGSPHGKYSFRIVHKSKTVVTAHGVARTETGATSLKLPLDTSDLAAGSYTLSVLEPGLDEWIEYSVLVR